MRLLVALALISLGALTAPVAASAAVGASPFTTVSPANGSSTKNVRVTFQWGGQCPTGHECRLLVEATQVANPPRLETGEFDKNKLGGSYNGGTVGTFGPMAPGSEMLDSPFPTPGVWYYQLVSSDVYVNGAGKRVTDVHTSALARFTVVPVVKALKMPVIASTEASRTMSFSAIFFGNVEHYDATFTAWVKKASGGWTKVWTKTVRVSTYMEHAKGQTAKGTNYGRWDVPRKSSLTKGADIKVTVAIRATGTKKVIATKTRTVKLFVTKA